MTYPTKTPAQPPRVMSPQEIAELTADARKEAALRAIEVLHPSKKMETSRNGKTEIRVQQ